MPSRLQAYPSAQLMARVVASVAVLSSSVVQDGVCWFVHLLDEETPTIIGGCVTVPATCMQHDTPIPTPAPSCNYYLASCIKLRQESYVMETRWIRHKGMTKLRATHYEVREFFSSIAYIWLEWLRMQSFCKPFTKHIMEITESRHDT